MLLSLCCPLLKAAAPSINLGHTKKISWECQDLNPGPLGAKRERYPLCYAAPKLDSGDRTHFPATPLTSWLLLSSSMLDFYPKSSCVGLSFKKSVEKSYQRRSRCSTIADWEKSFKTHFLNLEQKVSIPLTHAWVQEIEGTSLWGWRGKKRIWSWGWNSKSKKTRWRHGLKM